MATLRVFLALSMLATLAIFNYHINLEVLIESLTQVRDLIPMFGRRASVLTISLLVETGLFITTWTPRRNWLIGLLARGLAILRRLGSANLILFGVWIGLFSLLLISPYNLYFQERVLRISIAWLLCLGGAVFLKAVGVGRGWEQCILFTALALGVGYRLAIFTLDISAYPFSLGWSEASRYYYASLFFAERLYGISIPPSILHPSRYLMQAVPFMIPSSPLWLHRTWQVVLWLVSTMTTVGLLTRRIKIRDRFSQAAFVLWAVLFLLMAPVYYHLQVTIILVLWGYNYQKPWRTMLVVVIASIWAGISRINWIPVPGMLAATLFFLEESKESSPIFKYLSKPILWVFSGTAVAFLSQELYTRLSGNPAELFGSSLSSRLLWYRLLPNATYPLGILPGALLVITPALLAIFILLSNRWKSFHVLRLLGTSAILFVLFCGGLIVSVKIGGGSNLHNMDAFLCMFLIVSALFYFDKISTERASALWQELSRPLKITYQVMVVVALVVPVMITLDSSAKRNLPSSEKISEAINKIQSDVSAAVSGGGKVLFISERQLIIFGTITGVEMVPEYEKVFLMEMAMARNNTYLSEFYKRLHNHEFSLIVSEPLRLIYQDRSDSFGEENNAWVKNVAAPILCYYEAKRTLRDIRTELLVPKKTTTKCP